MDNSNPAVKDLTDQITSSENNKDVEKSLKDLKGSIDSLSEEIKKRGVKSIKDTSDETDGNKLPFLTMLKGLSKGFLNPFTDTNTLEQQLNTKQEEIPADKLKTNNIENKESIPEVTTKELKEQTAEENTSKAEKKNKTKDPELSNRLLVSISQMLNELRENAIEKQLLVEAIKIRAILEKENTTTSPAENIVPSEQPILNALPAENIVPNEQLISDIKNVPDKEGRIEPYLEDEKQKNNIPQVTVNDKIQNTPMVSAGGLEPGVPENNEETKTKDRELLSQSIADKLADLLGNIGGKSGLNIPDIPNGPDRSNSKTPGKTPEKLPGGSKLGVLKGGVGGLLGGLALDYAADTARESGHDQLGAGLDIGSSALSGAGMGAMIGSVVPGLGTAVGGAVGGLVGGAYGIYQNMDTLSNQAKSETDYVDKTRQLVPKDNQTSGSMLQNTFKKNEELKSQDEQISTRQMLQPIISNQTTNNSSQTLVPSAPVPNQNTNSYIQWRQSRSTYT